MKIVEDGNFVRWVRELFRVAGSVIVFCSLIVLNETSLRYWGASFGIFIVAIGRYSAQAHILGIRPLVLFNLEGVRPWIEHATAVSTAR